MLRVTEKMKIVPESTKSGEEEKAIGYIYVYMHIYKWTSRRVNILLEGSARVRVPSVDARWSTKKALYSERIRECV